MLFHIIKTLKIYKHRIILLFFFVAINEKIITNINTSTFAATSTMPITIDIKIETFWQVL